MASPGKWPTISSWPSTKSSPGRPPEARKTSPYRSSQRRKSIRPGGSPEACWSRSSSTSPSSRRTETTSPGRAGPSNARAGGGDKLYQTRAHGGQCHAVGEPARATLRRDADPEKNIAAAPSSPVPAEESQVKFLLSISGFIDALNGLIGRLVYWLVLVMVLVSAGNATTRYLFSIASNAWLELQWYLFAAVFLLCSGYTLRHNEHIRIDVIAGNLSRRAQMWIDVFGTLFFLLPMALYITWLSWPIFMNAWNSNEISGSAGGLVRWPARLLVPVGFFLLSLQGLSELIKRIAFLKGLIPDPLEKHEVPLELAIARDEAAK